MSSTQAMSERYHPIGECVNVGNKVFLRSKILINNKQWKERDIRLTNCLLQVNTLRMSSIRMSTNGSTVCRWTTRQINQIQRKFGSVTPCYDQIGPCWGWMNGDTRARQKTSKRARFKLWVSGNMSSYSPLLLDWEGTIRIQYFSIWHFGWYK